MTVKELIEHLTKLPQDAIVVYAVDEEGNAFHEISFEPNVGKFQDNDFISVSDESYAEYDGKIAVCVN